MLSKSKLGDMVAAVNLVAFFLLLLLNITGARSCGVTSPFVRKPQPSVDLSLDTFPPPPGYNAPEQVLNPDFLFFDSLVLLLLR